MYITTDNSVVFKNFVIHTFYGEETCFCWNEDKLAVFPYTSDSSVNVKVLDVPAAIKGIQCFNQRVFLICAPRGVYKLLKDWKFAILSKSAIGMGTAFYEVLVPRNKYLYLENKQDGTRKLLFQLSSEKDALHAFCVYPLEAENAAEGFFQAVTGDSSTKEDLCIIGDGKKVLKLVNDNVHIVYSSIYSIRNVIPVYEKSKVAALLLCTNTDVVIVMYRKDDALAFEKIFLGRKVEAICASFMESSRDTFWMIYSDESTLYYAKKEFSVENVERIAAQDKSFTCLQYFDSKMILGLTVNMELVEFSIATIESALRTENGTFVNLHSDMLKNTDLIMDKIYRGTQELHKLNETLLAEEDKLRRINLYAHKYKIKSWPKLSIHRIANQIFLSASFNDLLPRNTWIVVTLKSKYQDTFCMKEVLDEETVVDICIPEDTVTNFSEVAADLVTLIDKNRFWCLIRNFLSVPWSGKTKGKRRKLEKISFINSKIVALERLIREGNIDMKKLSNMKKIIRKEFNDS